jgi:hypothetical protein
LEGQHGENLLDTGFHRCDDFLQVLQSREIKNLNEVKRRTTMARKVEIRDNKLCIEIDLEKPTPSSSGKTLVVASTRGNAVTDVMVDGKPVTIGLNAYIKL